MWTIELKGDRHKMKILKISQIKGIFYIETLLNIYHDKFSWTRNKSFSGNGNE